MKPLFIPYELAVLAKEKGFNEPCLGYYNWRCDFKLLSIGITNSDADLISPTETIAAPLYQQIIDWFREKHDIHIEINSIGALWCFSFYKIHKGVSTECFFESDDIEMDYYEALNKAIEESLKLI